MSSQVDRKEAIRQFKERKIPRGIFAVRSAIDQQVWVDSTPNLDAARNSLYFCLRNQSHPSKTLQAEWNTHGDAAFAFEILEKLDDDVMPMALRDLLRERRRHWAEKLGAQTLSP